MERVAFLVEETNERITCLLNPESIMLRRAAGIRKLRSIGGVLTGAELADDKLLFTGGGMTELFLDLLFDVDFVDPNLEVGDVRELTSKIWKLTENSAEQGSFGMPSQVRFVWGKSWNIPGVISSISEHLDYFNSDGVPLRSWLRMRFLRVIENITEEDLGTPFEPSVAATDENILDQLDFISLAEGQTPADEIEDNVTTHQYVSGERLDQLVRQNYGFYGHPSLWRLIASYNGINDPLNIQPGTIIRFPPINKLE